MRKQIWTFYQWFWVIAIVFAGANTLAFAFDTREIRTPKGTQALTLQYSTNENGEREVLVSHKHLSRLYPDVPSLVMIGRDLNDDNYFDAWFLVDDTGVIKTIERSSRTADGWDVIALILKENVDFKQMSIWRTMYLRTYGEMTFSGRKTHQYLRMLLDTQVDLSDLELRVTRARKSKRIDPQKTAEYYSVLADGWAWLSGPAPRDGLKSHIFWALTDVVSILSASAIGTSLQSAYLAKYPWLATMDASLGHNLIYKEFTTQLGSTAFSSLSRTASIQLGFAFTHSSVRKLDKTKKPTNDAHPLTRLQYAIWDLM